MNVTEIPDQDWNRVYKDRVAGKISHDEIRLMVRGLHTPKYQRMLTQWMEGTLFFSQKATYEAWLGMSDEIQAEENQRASEYLGFELGCSEQHNEDIHTFIQKRIWTPGASKRQYIADHADLKEGMRDTWRKQNTKYRWEWRG